MPSRIVVAAALPPPVHGQSLVNQIIVSMLKAAAPTISVIAIDIGPRIYSSRLTYICRRLKGNFNAALAIMQHITAESKVFYTVVETGWGIVFNFALLGMARAFGYRLVLHHHSSGHTLAERVAFRRLLSVAGPRILHVVLDTEMSRDLRRYAAVQRVFVLPNLFVVPSQDPNLASRRLGPLRIGFLSNLTNEKGMDVLLDMAARTSDSNVDIKYLIAGPLSSPGARTAAREARARSGERIDFLGPLYGGDKDAFFRGIDIFCFPSRYVYEAQPLVVIEAMSHGCALIVSAQGYIPSLVGDAGIVLEPHSMAEQALAVCTRWLTDRDDLHRYQRAARQRFAELRDEADQAIDVFVATMGEAGDGVALKTRHGRSGGGESGKSELDSPVQRRGSDRLSRAPNSTLGERRSQSRSDRYARRSDGSGG